MTGLWTFGITKQFTLRHKDGCPLDYSRSSEKTYKVDRTTVTVGTPRMLAISTIPASMAASSSAWASFGYSITAAGEGLCLPSPADACELSAPVPCCAKSGTLPLVVGGRLILLSTDTPTVSQVSSSFCSSGLLTDKRRIHL
jgi:hypothetical protein